MQFLISVFSVELVAQLLRPHRPFLVRVLLSLFGLAQSAPLYPLVLSSEELAEVPQLQAPPPCWDLTV